MPKSKIELKSRNGYVAWFSDGMIISKTTTDEILFEIYKQLVKLNEKK